MATLTFEIYSFEMHNVNKVCAAFDFWTQLYHFFFYEMYYLRFVDFLCSYFNLCQGGPVVAASDIWWRSVNEETPHIFKICLKWITLDGHILFVKKKTKTNSEKHSILRYRDGCFGIFQNFLKKHFEKKCWVAKRLQTVEI